MNHLTEYVCGFMFDTTLSRVVLLRKNRPEWQAGRWNGVGGHIEPGEPPRNAMAREFHEEAGIATSPDDWVLIGTLEVPTARVLFYAMRHHDLGALAQKTDEAVQAFFIEGILEPDQFIPTIPNVPALIAHAISFYRYESGSFPGYWTPLHLQS